MEYRLNKYISGSGYCSRREADKFIEEGNVTVNGKRAAIGMSVFPGQRVKVNGNLIANEVEPVYIAFNKPVGVVSTTDPTEKDNLIDFISHEQRIFPIGRLDKDSQGLILLTNDGDIVNKILRAGNNHKKEYIVTVNKAITPQFLKGMAGGVPVLDRVTRKCTLVEINPFMFSLSLIQGLNRQIRRMCEYFGYEVVKLERIQIMNIKLDKLGQGNWRNLTNDELDEMFDLLEDSEKNAEPKTTSKAPKKKHTQEKTLEEDPKKRTEKQRTKLRDSRTSSFKTKGSIAKAKASSGPRVGKQKKKEERPKYRK